MEREVYTPEEFQREFGAGGSKKRQNKFGVGPKEKRRSRGRVYDSIAEREYADMLWTCVKSGEFLDLIEQPRLWLGVPENIVIPDFLIVPRHGAPWYVDVKGHQTPAFKLACRWWRHYGRLELHIVARCGRGFETLEVIARAFPYTD